MTTITINDLQPADFIELSDLELEGVIGGKSKIVKNITSGIVKYGPTVVKIAGFFL